MSYIKTPCPVCNKPKSRKSQLCGECELKSRPVLSICPECKGPKTPSSTLCKDCYEHKGIKGYNTKLVEYAKTVSGKDLAKKIERVGWTIREAALEAGLSIQTVASWINGKAIPKKNALKALMNVLGFDVCPTCNGLGYVDPEELSNGNS